MQAGYLIRASCFRRLGAFDRLFHIFRFDGRGVFQTEFGGFSSDVAMFVTSFGSVAGRDELFAKHVAELVRVSVGFALEVDTLVVGSRSLSFDLLNKLPHLRRLRTDGDATDFLSPPFLLVVVDNFGDLGIQFRNAGVSGDLCAEYVAQSSSFGGLRREAVRLEVFYSAARDVVFGSLVHDVPEFLLAADGISWWLEFGELLFTLFGEVLPVCFLEVGETSSRVVDGLVVIKRKTNADREVVAGQLCCDVPLGYDGDVASSQRDVRRSFRTISRRAGRDIFVQYDPVGVDDFFCNFIAACVCGSSSVPKLFVGIYISEEQSTLESGQVLKRRFVPGGARGLRWYVAVDNRQVLVAEFDGDSLLLEGVVIWRSWVRDNCEVHILLH